MITAQEFENLFLTYFEQLYKLANCVLKDAEESRDVVHEVFAQLWEKQPKIKPGKVKSYLTQATYNACLNQIKRRGTFEALREAYLYEQRFSAQRDCLDLELWSQIDTFIQTELPPRTREALNLCFGEKKSYREAAELMGVGIEAINRYVVIGLRKLREKFNNNKTK